MSALFDAFVALRFGCCFSFTALLQGCPIYLWFENPRPVPTFLWFVLGAVPDERYDIVSRDGGVGAVKRCANASEQTILGVHSDFFCVCCVHKAHVGDEKERVRSAPPAPRFRCECVESSPSEWWVTFDVTQDG